MMLLYLRPLLVLLIVTSVARGEQTLQDPLVSRQIAPVIVAPQPTPPSTPLPGFLQPPPQELLRKGLQPLSNDLPDTSVRDGLMPPDASQGLFGGMATDPSYDRGEQWVPISFHWCASGNRYLPLYFQDTMLERHGQAYRPFIQPAASGARFFAAIAALPYKSVVDPPLRPMSVLGHYRTGSNAPCLSQRPPLQLDAALVEAGAVLGLIFIVP